MAYEFTNAGLYTYRDGDVFLGLNPQTGQEVGIKTERHLVTIASARSGKGACLIIPNLLRWKSSVLVIDPKGENLVETWEAREDLGHEVAALDPFHEAALGADGEHIRATFNPLDMIQGDQPRDRERVMMLADGMVPVHDPNHMEWVAGCRSIIAGVIAFVIAEAPEPHRNLSTVRRILMQDKDALNKDATLMLDCSSCGGLAAAAGRSIQLALSTDKGLPPQFLHKAKEITHWLDSPEISRCLSSSSFKIDDLKQGRLSLYLVLPPDEISTYIVFFLMIVKVSLKVMMTGGTKAQGECLFILDEFASLGKIEIIEEAAGRMPGYGVHLWPFMQNIGQLQKLYGKEGTETFLGSADAQIYFDPRGSLTLEYISHMLGRFKAREVAGLPPVAPVTPNYKDNDWNAHSNAAEIAKYQTEMSRYQDAMRSVNTPRLTPSEIASITGKGNQDAVARSMIVFAKAGDVLNLKLAPYFEEHSSIQSHQKTAADWTDQQIAAISRSWALKAFFTHEPIIKRAWRFIIVAMSALFSGVVCAIFVASLYPKHWLLEVSTIPTEMFFACFIIGLCFGGYVGFYRYWKINYNKYYPMFCNQRNEAIHQRARDVATAKEEKLRLKAERAMQRKWKRTNSKDAQLLETEIDNQVVYAPQYGILN